MGQMPDRSDPRWQSVEDIPMLDAKANGEYTGTFFNQVWELTDEDQVTHRLVIGGVNRRARTGRPPQP